MPNYGQRVLQKKMRADQNQRKTYALVKNMRKDSVG
jgi:hypothetical protein